MYKYPLVLLALISLSGCAFLTPPKERPVIEDKVKGVGVLSVTPERRTVLVLDENTPSKFCAEPSPDVAEGITSTLRALAEAAVKDESGKTIEASAEIAKNFSSSINTLFIRSQGIQYFRDGSFALSQALQNKAITPSQFAVLLTTLLDKSESLIKDEIPQIKELKELQILQDTQKARDESVKSSSDAKLSADEAKTAATNAKKYADEAKAAENTAKDSAKETKDTAPQ
jgi:hypothetical protein